MDSIRHGYRVNNPMIGEEIDYTIFSLTNICNKIIKCKQKYVFFLNVVFYANDFLLFSTDTAIPENKNPLYGRECRKAD